MALLPKKANTPENKEGLGDRSAMPAGDYVVHVVKGEFKQTKNKKGHYLALMVKVLEGDHTGKVVFLNLNLDNPNPVAVEIANKELNSICQACGLVGVEDSDELLEIPFGVTLKVKPATAQYPEGNEIANYMKASEVSTASSGPAPEKTDSAPPTENGGGTADGKKLPWE